MRAGASQMRTRPSEGLIALTQPAARRLLSALAPVMLVLAAMASMQVGAAFAKGLFGRIGPLGATSLRLGFAGLIMAALRRPWRGPHPRDARAALIAYGLSLGAMNTLFYLALRTVPLGIAVALEFLGPLSVAVLAARRRLDLAWAGLAAAGLLLLLPVGAAADRVDLTGSALALASGACWALYIVFGRRVAGAYGARGAALGLMIAAAAFAPLDGLAARTAIIAPAALASGVMLGVLSSALPYSLEMMALARLPAGAFGAMMSLEPGIAALAGLVVLGERPSSGQWLGMAAIIAASLGASLTSPAAAEPAPT